MKFKMTEEMRNNFSKKATELFKEYSYNGNKNVPSELLESSEYRRIIKEFISELISNSIKEQPEGNIEVNLNFDASEGNKTFDQLVSLGRDYLIAIDIKRARDRLYPNILSVPTEDMSEYQKSLLNVMIANEMVKPKTTYKKWIKKWVSVLNKWDKKGINDLAKARTQKGGLAGIIERNKYKRAIKKQNPSPVNARGLDAVLKAMTDVKESNNLAQLTPDIYKALTVKNSESTPKVNQEETVQVENKETK